MERSLYRLIAVLGAVLALSCESHEPQRMRDRPDTPPESVAAEPAPVIAAPARSNVEAAAARAEYRIVPAPVDDAYATGDPVSARRIVYRVVLRIPPGFGTMLDSIHPATGELYIDASVDRLRARFAGTGWPVEEGAELRLRRDAAGAYVFDDEGGRPFGPGQLGRWFQGGRLDEKYIPPVRIRMARDKERGDAAIAAMICVLLAEWSGQPLTDLERRCEAGIPPSFRIGGLFADRTADVPLTLPRSALRADHESPPAKVDGAAAQTFFSAATMARMPPDRPISAEPDATAELVVRNQKDTKLVLTFGRMAIGWVDPHAELHVGGLRPGHYRVGAVRPFGVPARRPVRTAVPGELTIR